MLYALCLSYHSNTEVILFACPSSGWATTTGRVLGPKVRNSIKCLSQGHSDALPHRESNQGFATFRLLAHIVDFYNFVSLSWWLLLLKILIVSNEHERNLKDVVCVSFNVQFIYKFDLIVCLNVVYFYNIISLFTWSKQKWLFWRAGFYPANQNNLKFLKRPDWLEKIRPSKKPLLILSCKQAICDVRKIPTLDALYAKYLRSKL